MSQSHLPYKSQNPECTLFVVALIVTLGFNVRSLVRIFMKYMLVGAAQKSLFNLYQIINRT